MRNVQQTDSNISSDASPVIISSTVYRLHHMSTCSYINQDCFSSAGKKNYLHLPVVSDSQTGWKQDEPTSDNIPCLADTLYMPGEMEARHTLLIINWFYRCSSTVTKWKHGVHSRHLKTWIPQPVCKLFIPIQSYSYIFDMQESYGVTLWHCQNPWAFFELAAVSSSGSCHRISILCAVATFVFSRRQFLWVQVGTSECGGYYWQMTSNDQLISLDPVFKHLTQTLFRSVTSVKKLHLIHGCSMKSHHRCWNPDFANASRFRFDPFACQCFSSRKRYDSSWAGEIFLRCDLLLMVGVVDTGHLPVTWSADMSWPGSRPFSASLGTERVTLSAYVMGFVWLVWGKRWKKSTCCAVLWCCCHIVCPAGWRAQMIQMQCLNEVAAMSEAVSKRLELQHR